MSDTQLRGKKVAFLFTEGVERAELIEPLNAVREAGGSATLLSLDTGKVRTFNHLDPADEIEIDGEVAASSPEDYDALVLPGGVANPDALRADEDAVKFVGDFVSSDKPVAVICHGPWTLIEAGAVKGRTLTSWPSLKTDIRNAGGEWVDEEVHVDGNLISSRNPDDLPAFCSRLVQTLAS